VSKELVAKWDAGQRPQRRSQVDFCCFGRDGDEGDDLEFVRDNQAVVMALSPSAVFLRSIQGELLMVCALRDDG